MCKRHTSDPLVRLFIDEWRLNPLAVPRERADPGNVWIKRGRGVSGPVELLPLLVSPISVPQPAKPQKLGEINTTSSNAYDVKVGIGLLEAFLTAIGAAAVVQRVRVGYTHKRARAVRVRFADATLERIDPGELGKALATARFDETHPLAHPNNRRFVAAAVMRSPSLTIVAQDARENSVDLGAGVLAAVNATGAVQAESGETGEVTYTGKKLVVGVELYELHTRADGSLSMGLPGEAEFRAGRPARPVPAFLGDDEEALITLEPLEPSGDDGDGGPTVD